MAAPAERPSLDPGRIPADTLRRVRLFYGKEREELADMFKVSVRTIFRWEAAGVDPRTLARDPDAHPSAGPEWRCNLLIWMVNRYLQTGVTDNCKE